TTIRNLRKDQATVMDRMEADSRKLRLHEVIPTETRLTITNRQSLQDVKILHLNIYHLKPVTHIQRMQDTREIPMRNPARRMLTR
ncbi:MAG: hypothetical protein ACLSG4_00275, partial [Anaerobutyricum sp.]